MNGAEYFGSQGRTPRLVSTWRVVVTDGTAHLSCIGVEESDCSWDEWPSALFYPAGDRRSCSGPQRCLSMMDVTLANILLSPTSSMASSCCNRLLLRAR